MKRPGIRSDHAERRTLPRPSISLFGAVVIIVGLMTGLSVLLGLGDVAIYGALVALYLGMGAFGGTLRADLTVAAVYAFGLVLFVSGPVLMAMVSFPTGAALLVLAVGLCGIIPALGSRYGTVRLGLGLITVYAFGYQTTRGASAAHVIAMSFVGLGLILTIRLIAAVPDPDAPLRRAVAAILTDGARAPLETAIEAWLRGPARAWTGHTLAGAVQYRGAFWAITQRDDVHRDPGTLAFLERARALAESLAQHIRGRRPRPEAVDALAQSLDALDAAALVVDQANQGAAQLIADGLRRVAGSAASRDRRVIHEAAVINRAATWGALRAAMSFDSDYFRNALRSMISLAVALLIVHVAKQPAFALPLLMGAYGVQQATFLGSVEQARRRSIGVVVGAIVATAIVATASPTAAIVASALALIVAFAYISTSITIFMGALVVTLTIAVAPLVHVDPTRYAIGYALAVIVGAAIATTVGYLTVPPPTPQRRRRMLTGAMRATADAIDSIGREAPDEQRHRMLVAFRKQQNTTIATTGEPAGIEDGTAGVGGLKLLCLATVLGIAPLSSAANRTRAAVVDALRSDARDPLPDVGETGDTVFDATDQLMRYEYDRLHRHVTSSG